MDLLDHLRSSRFCTTLDLASGFWQVKTDDESWEKTAFITHHGLFEFHAMPFGLTNAPGIFQRLMQRVLEGVKPEDGQILLMSTSMMYLCFPRPQKAMWSTFVQS